MDISVNIPVITLITVYPSWQSSGSHSLVGTVAVQWQHQFTSHNLEHWNIETKYSLCVKLNSQLLEIHNSVTIVSLSCMGSTAGQWTLHIMYIFIIDNHLYHNVCVASSPHGNSPNGKSPHRNITSWIITSHLITPRMDNVHWILSFLAHFLELLSWNYFLTQ